MLQTIGKISYFFKESNLIKNLKIHFNSNQLNIQYWNKNIKIKIDGLSTINVHHQWEGKKSRRRQIYKLISIYRMIKMINLYYYIYILYLKR